MPEKHTELNKVKTKLDELKSQTERAKDTWGQPAEIIGLLTEVTRSLHEDVVARERESDQVFERLVEIETNVKNMSENISSLCRLVRDGNGQPSLLQRLSNLEVVVANNKDTIDELKTHANTIIAAKALSKAQVIAGLTGMVVTALISALALIATLMK